MAKKKAAPKLPENCKAGKVGKGWRYCLKCEHSTKGGRTKVCANPACGVAFPAPKKKAAPKPPAPRGTGMQFADAAPPAPTTFKGQLKAKKAELQKQIDAIDVLLGE